MEAMAMMVNQDPEPEASWMDLHDRVPDPLPNGPPRVWCELPWVQMVARVSARGPGNSDRPYHQ